MELWEYERYGRQMIVPEMGLQGQLALKRSKVLVVGAGGLGCPAIAYLGGAGVGTSGIVDPDRVEVSNLHRQILHHELGKPKAESAAEYVRQLNPNVECRIWVEPLTAVNALDIVKEFDIVLDCTDTPMSRYLINDACVLSKKPLVSASALKTEGQLAVYNFGEKGPCYRCVFPKPPPPQLVGTCSDNGILGPVVGLMGVSQAIEVIKVLLNFEKVRIQHESPQPFSSIYSMFSFPQWRQMKLRFRKPECSACGENSNITSLTEFDYANLCGSINQATTSFRSSPEEFASKNGQILDVRSPPQFSIAALPGSVSLPISQLRKMNKDDFTSKFSTISEDGFKIVCHHGNDSQEAVEILRKWGISAYDLAGGLSSWSRHDATFPKY